MLVSTHAQSRENSSVCKDLYRQKKNKTALLPRTGSQSRGDGSPHILFNMSYKRAPNRWQGSAIFLSRAGPWRKIFCPGCGRAGERHGPKFRGEVTQSSLDSGGDVTERKKKGRDGYGRAAGSSICSP